MYCLQCNKNEDRVLETRELANGVIIRRRRECLSCGFRFTSYERIEESPVFVVKRNNTREQFKRKKLRSSIDLAVRKRPVSSETINAILDSIEVEIEIKAGTSREVSSSFLGTLVVENLQKIDTVAYLRFLSVYKNFETKEEFIREISHISEKTEGNSNSKIEN